MEGQPATQLEEVAKPPKPTIVTIHGEHATLWHVLDRSAAEADQPAVIRTFSSVRATREEATRFLRELPAHS